jgi:hypothetical protein
MATCYVQDSDISVLGLAGEVRDQIVAMLPPVRNFSASDTLFVMLRGGDTMHYPRASHNAGQPPCDYFLRVMKKFPTTVMVTAGENPCHDIVINAVPSGGRATSGRISQLSSHPDILSCRDRRSQ